MPTPEHPSRRLFLASTLKGAVAGILTGQSSAVIARAAAADSPTDTWQIGCFTRPWGDQDYRVALDAIAEAGFKYVGLMTTKTKSQSSLIISVATSLEEAQRAGEESKKRKLKIASVYGGGIPVEKSVQAGIDGLRRLIDNCAVAGSSSLLMGGIGDAKLYKVYYKAIAECCDYAAEKKVAITLKPHGGLNATGPQCRKTIEEVGHKNFRLWYDPGNIFYYSDGKLDPVADAGAVDGIVTGVCVKDYRHPKDVMLTPGTGKVDFAGVLARLRKGGFTRGPLIIETLAAGDLAATLAEARKARQFVEGLTREAGTP